MKGSIELIRLIAIILIAFTHTRYNIDNTTELLIIKTLPTIGTSILSVISGYLFWKYTKNSDHIFQKKVKSLLIPYIIANLVVLIPSIILHNIFNINLLNRLEFNYKLITEGLFSLNSPPINPPTYFVRDLFVIYSIIAILFNKNWKLLLFLIPVIIFGKLILRYDILILFVSGILIARFEKYISNKYIIILLFFLSVITIVLLPEYQRYLTSITIFLIMTRFEINFPYTGGFTYLLHLYHTPIIVISYPFIVRFIPNSFLNVIIQVLISVAIITILYMLSRKCKILKILSGSR